VSLDGHRCQHCTAFQKIRGKPLQTRIFGHFAQLGCSSGISSVAERIREDHIEPNPVKRFGPCCVCCSVCFDYQLNPDDLFSLNTTSINMLGVEPRCSDCVRLKVLFDAGDITTPGHSLSFFVHVMQQFLSNQGEKDMISFSAAQQCAAYERTYTLNVIESLRTKELRMVAMGNKSDDERMCCLTLVTRKMNQQESS
jgi:hypothetical protein